MAPDRDQLRKQEQSRRIGNVLGFIKQAETKYPNLSAQLPDILLGLLGSKEMNPDELSKNEGFINAGVKVMGDWLSTCGFKGFVLQLGLTDQVKEAGVRAKIAFETGGSLPDRNSFFRSSGVPSEHWAEIQNALVDLSATIREALEIGYQPKQVVAALFIESTARPGDERLNTSLATREMLNRASGGQLSRVNQILNNWMQGK